MFRGQGFALFVAAGHVDNGERLSENFAPAGQFVVRHKKKVRLVYIVGCGNVKFRARNSLRHGEVDLPKSLLEDPPLHNIFRDLLTYLLRPQISQRRCNRLNEAANAQDYTIYAAVLNEEEVVVKQIGK